VFFFRLKVTWTDFVSFAFIVDIYRVIRNDCRGFHNLSYTIHLR